MESPNLTPDELRLARAVIGLARVQEEARAARMRARPPGSHDPRTIDLAVAYARQLRALELRLGG